MFSTVITMTMFDHFDICMVNKIITLTATILIPPKISLFI